VAGTQTAVPKYTNPGLCFPLVEGSIPQGAGIWITGIYIYYISCKFPVFSLVKEHVPI